MTNTLLIITKDIDATFAVVYQKVDKIERKMGIEYLVVAALHNTLSSSINTAPYCNDNSKKDLL